MGSVALVVGVYSRDLITFGTLNHKRLNHGEGMVIGEGTRIQMNIRRAVALW